MIKFAGALAGAALAVLGAGAAMPAQAGTVTGTYTGHVDDIGGSPGQFAIGDAVSFSFSYDDTIAPDTPDPQSARYYSSGITGSGSIGSYTFSVGGSSTNFVAVIQVPGTDAFAMEFNLPIAAAAINGFVLQQFDFELDGGPNVFADDSLPTSYIPMSKFFGNGFSLTFEDEHGNFAGVQGVFDGTTSPTPIPAALPLFMSALGGMGLIGWRRRRCAAI